MASNIAAKNNLLKIRDLSVDYWMPAGSVSAVRDISFDVNCERVGIVGESGSGKSTVGRAILGLIRPPGRIRAGSIQLEGEELVSKTPRQMRLVRGRRISMVMQDPKYSLNPVLTVGEQIEEAYRVHSNSDKQSARERTLEMLNAVRIRDPRRVATLYPHELSGGMGQRVMIAMMLIPGPQLLIADEPTSALDVSVRIQVLSILDELVRERGMGLIFISHDLDLVRSFCDRVLIMYAGKIVDVCAAKNLPAAAHPYTRGLLNCLPRINAPVDVLPNLQRDPKWTL
jgi:peptide/nickel transport system ATP-binding protein